MSNVRPIAILVSDLHLSLKQPACRADDDWLEVQGRYLQQLNDLAIQKSKKIPVICAGDIFDKWNPPAELIHFALEFLPDKMICVPGQHDLPNHAYEEMHRCGYGVLSKAGKIEDISQELYLHKDFLAVGFPWGVDLCPWKDQGVEVGQRVTLAVIHRYCWQGMCKYPDAPKEAEADSFKDQLKGYDVAVFGDNHLGFLTDVGKCQVLNCGGFIRRKSDEIKYKPKVGVLYSDGQVTRASLDTSKDKFHDPKTIREEMPFDMKGLIDELKELGEHGLNFKEEVIRHLDREKVDAETRKAVLEALEE